MRDIVKRLEYAACAIDRGIPYIGEQFDEMMESTVGRAKTEIEAHVSAMAMRIGVETMRVEAVKSAPRLVEPSENDVKEGGLS